MDAHVLVAYATKYGSTAEIADRIGQTLEQAGLNVTVMPVDRVTTLEPYQAVVLGSAVYIGQWRKTAVDFLKKNEPALSQMPTWLFSTGPIGEGDPMQLTKGWRFPARLQPIADRIRPRDITVFQGELDPEVLNPVEKLVAKTIKVPSGDFRDWNAIVAWSSAIAETLKQTT